MYQHNVLLPRGGGSLIISFCEHWRGLSRGWLRLVTETITAKQRITGSGIVAGFHSGEIVNNVI